jgi:hypothetical protein
MKQIQIVLSHIPDLGTDWCASTAFGRVGFCGGVIKDIQPEAANSSSLNMTLSATQQPGFVAVNLRHPAISNFWRWEIPSLNLVDPNDTQAKHIFSFVDDTVNAALRRLMGKGVSYQVPLAHTVWVRITPA